MMTKTVIFAAALSAALLAPAARAAAAEPVATQTAPASAGLIEVRSAYGIDETIRRIKADIAAKGIRFFDDIDQSALGAGANIAIRPSHLLLFGNPPLGVQFLTSSPYAAIDWPVRMIVFENADGGVTIAWTDFDYIAKRHGITDRAAQFKMASEVAASIASSATK